MYARGQCKACKHIYYLLLGGSSKLLNTYGRVLTFRIRNGNLAELKSSSPISEPILFAGSEPTDSSVVVKKQQVKKRISERIVTRTGCCRCMGNICMGFFGRFCRQPVTFNCPHIVYGRTKTFDTSVRDVPTEMKMFEGVIGRHKYVNDWKGKWKR